MAQCGGGPGPARLSILACAEEPVTILGRLPAAVASKEGREGAWGEGGPPRDSWAKASSDQRLSCSLAWSPFFFLILVFPSGKPVDCFLRFLPLPTQACFLPCGGYPSPGPQEPPGAPLGPCPWLFPQRGPQVPSALALSSHPGQAHVCPVPHRGVTLPHPRVTRRPRQAQLCPWSHCDLRSSRADPVHHRPPKLVWTCPRLGLSCQVLLGNFALVTQSGRGLGVRLGGSRVLGGHWGGGISVRRVEVPWG